MNTDELVRLLAQDGTVDAAPGRQLLRALAPAVVVALALFLLLAGWRPDLLASMASPRFVFKAAINAALLLGAAGALLRLARPQSRAGRWRALLWAIPVLLAVAAGIELWSLPRELWWEAARGSNSTWCLRLIPALSAAPLVASLWMLRRAAPGRPVAAGAAAGLFSAGIGGLLYAMHCPDDSPLFVVLWYGCATAIVAAAGALAGSRWLRW